MAEGTAGDGGEAALQLIFTVNPAGYEHNLTVAPGATVSEVRAALGADLGIATEQITLAFGGMPLGEDGATLVDVGVAEASAAAGGL